MEKISDLLQKRKEKIEELKRNNINLFPNGYVVSHIVNDIRKIVEKTHPADMAQILSYFDAEDKLTILKYCLIKLSTCPGISPNFSQLLIVIKGFNDPG